MSRVLEAGLSAAHVFTARGGFISRPSHLGPTLTRGEIRIKNNTVIERRRIYACFFCYRLHQEVIDCGDLRTVTGDEQILATHDVCSITSFLECGCFQYRSMWAGGQ